MLKSPYVLGQMSGSTDTCSIRKEKSNAFLSVQSSFVHYDMDWCGVGVCVTGGGTHGLHVVGKGCLIKLHPRSCCY